MKKKSIKLTISAIAITLLLVSGCKKEEMPSKTVEVSAPTINLIGDPVVILNVGDSYTDQGATYYDSLYGDNGTLSTTTEINTSEEGFFIVTYSATNQYGFEGSGTRLVAVTNANDQLDVSGDYLRTATGGESTVSKIGRGVFWSDNVAGGSSRVDGVYFMFTADSSMIMPDQTFPNYGVQASFSSASYDFEGSPQSYTYKISAPGFGTSARTFYKQ